MQEVKNKSEKKYVLLISDGTSLRTSGNTINSSLYATVLATWGLLIIKNYVLGPPHLN